ncbi:MAG TPA: helix-turn-helix domain-containing protein [Terriglobia bacterium]|nr:helix-turn-helix domain-containing protein [Terriglobia bacterium]
MEPMTAAKVVRKVRKRIEVSQEGLARLLNATKGAVQHWERGRNNPDLARLNALRQLCPAGAERKELDNLIKQTQARLAPLPEFKPGELAKAVEGGTVGTVGVPGGSFIYLRRENHKLQRQVTRLEGLLQRRTEQVRILEDLATELQREMAKLKAGQEAAPAAVPSAAAPAEG